MRHSCLVESESLIKESTNDTKTLQFWPRISKAKRMLCQLIFLVLKKSTTDFRIPTSVTTSQITSLAGFRSLRMDQNNPEQTVGDCNKVLNCQEWDNSPENWKPQLSNKTVAFRALRRYLLDLRNSSWKSERWIWGEKTLLYKPRSCQEKTT